MNQVSSILLQTTEKLRKNQQTLATAESCTGGMLGEWVTQIPGASEVYLGGMIAYSNLMKIQSLHVPKQILEKYGAVSEPTAFYMAQGIQKIFGATWGISITGVAGPGGASKQKPVGTICFGIAGPHGITTKQVIFKDLGRQENRKQAIFFVLKWFNKQLSEF